MSMLPLRSLGLAGPLGNQRSSAEFLGWNMGAVCNCWVCVKESWWAASKVLFAVSGAAVASKKESEL